MKKLTAYFSASGTTAKAAEALAEAAGTDIFEIKPAVPYTKEDLDWMNKKSRSSTEMSDPASRPEIAEKIKSMEDYDLIFLGFPIWWYTAPTIIKTFLESYDFSGKKIVLFATSGSSGLGNTAETLKKSLPSSAVIAGGRMLNGSLDKAELTRWASQFTGR